jgi:hypothetical protein
MKSEIEQMALEAAFNAGLVDGRAKVAFRCSLISRITREVGRLMIKCYYPLWYNSHGGEKPKGFLQSARHQIAKSIFMRGFDVRDWEPANLPWVFQDPELNMAYRYGYGLSVWSFTSEKPSSALCHAGTIEEWVRDRHRVKYAMRWPSTK